MAYPDDFYETLVAASSEATAALQLPNSFVDTVYRQYSPMWQGALGQTLNINVPDVNVANASDEGANGLTGITPSDTKTSITINHKYGSNRKISNYTEAITAGELGQIYIQPVIEEVLRKLDQALCALVTSTNFSTNGSTTLGADVFTNAHLATLWALLRTQGVPMDMRNLFFATHTTVMGNALASDDFSKESVVGVSQAEMAQQDAMVVRRFKMTLVDDPYMPVASGAYSSLAYHRFAFGLRTVTPPLQQTGHVSQTVVFPRPQVPVVLESWYEPKDQARYIHGYCICGHAVVRENLGAFAVTT